MHPILEVTTEKSPREVIAFNYPPGLPIQGGWGYTMDSACVMNRADPMLKRGKPFRLVRLERSFVEKRIYQELIIGRALGQKFSGIEWKLLVQRLIWVGEKAFDRLDFEVTAFRDQDWAVLKEEYMGAHGHGTPGFDEEAHARKRVEMQVRLTRVFWFDVTAALDE